MIFCQALLITETNILSIREVNLSWSLVLTNSRCQEKKKVSADIDLGLVQRMIDYNNYRKENLPVEFM